MLKQKALIVILSLGIVGVLSYSFAQKAYAMGNMNQTNLIQKLIEKFNLNSTEVDQVVQEFRQEKFQEMKTNIDLRLASEVGNGNLTEEQKNKIMEKMAEMHEKRQSNQNLTVEERRTAMEEHRKELSDWATQNGIDLKYIMGMNRMHKGGFRGMQTQ